MGNGHVFVVEGTIGKLVADATIIPTDQSFTVERYWHHALPIKKANELPALKPEHWEERGWGRSQDGRNVWFVHVADDPSGPAARYDRLRAALSDIAAQSLSPQVKGRQYPLVVLPVIGTRGGGFGERRGESIQLLLDTCTDFESGSATIDVAIVTQTPATYGALQEHRRTRAKGSYPGIDLAEAERLGNLAQQGQLALFIGAGASIPAGAPSWKALIEHLAEQAGLDGAVRATLSKLDALDQAELLAAEPGGENGLADRIAKAIKVEHPALAHALLAALQCQQAVTTNYDALYEAAVTARNGTIAVLPMQLPQGNGQWILKLHGDLEVKKSLVLTRRQFVRFTAISEPSGAMLQSMLLTRHLLIVGTSMSDPNVLRLIHEVAEYRDAHRVDSNRKAADSTSGKEKKSAEEKFGTILDVSDDAARRRLNETHFTWLTMSGDDLPPRARSLEIFLDAVAMYAASDRSWLLDPKYSGLHADRDPQLTKKAVELYQAITRSDHQDDAWEALAASLRAFGARDTGVSAERGGGEVNGGSAG